MKKRTLAGRALFAINILTAVLLALSYAAPHVDPNVFWPPAFAGIGFPFLYAVNAGFLLYWLWARSRRVLLPLFFLVAGLGTASLHIQAGGREDAPGDSAACSRVLSFNVRLFDFYNWTDRRETKDSILALLRQEQADIVCFQEFFMQDTGDHITLQDILGSTGPAQQVHIETTTFLKKHLQHFGVATFSRYPIFNMGTIRFTDGSNNICIFTDVAREHDTVRIYNMHLQSVHLRPEDYRFMEHPGEEDDAGRIRSSRRILSKLRTAYRKRAKQAGMVRRHIERSPYPVIVCGDFNDSPASYTYATIGSGLADAFLEAGSGLGRTYSGSLPAFRIDYILHSRQLSTESFRIVRRHLSDHYPLVACVR